MEKAYRIKMVYVVAAIVTFVFLFALAAYNVPTETRVLEPFKAPDEVDEIVFVTPGGKKYHKAGCRFMKQSEDWTAYRPETAERMGYEACKVCAPVISSDSGE